MDKNILLNGIGASPGIIIGKALLVDHGRPDFSHYRLLNDKSIGDEKLTHLDSKPAFIGDRRIEYDRSGKITEFGDDSFEYDGFGQMSQIKKNDISYDFEISGLNRLVLEGSSLIGNTSTKPLKCSCISNFNLSISWIGKSLIISFKYFLSTVSPRNFYILLPFILTYLFT